MTILSCKPPLGTKDRDPAEFRRRQYLFSAWRRVCIRFGYEEYLTPLIEDKAIYEAKSGDEVGGIELSRITNKEGELTDFVIRPELTPSVTRLVSGLYPQLPKPLRRFAIPNFYRNEKPQKGRNREFWQLNIDIFGSRDPQADQEMLSLMIEIMQELGATPSMRTLCINDRRLITTFLDTIALPSLHSHVARCMDKRKKRTLQENTAQLSILGLDEKGIAHICAWMQATSLTDCQKICPALSPSLVTEIQDTMKVIQELYPTVPIVFSPSVIRGFDYYDGIVFEVLDTFPGFDRSLAGGGRYNGLGSIFGCDDLPAVGLGSGDEPMMIFLQNRNLLPSFSLRDVYYLPLLEGVPMDTYRLLCQSLRRQGYACLPTFTPQKFSKIFADAEKRGCRFAVVFGSREAETKTYSLKDLADGTQTTHQL